VSDILIILFYFNLTIGEDVATKDQLIASAQKICKGQIKKAIKYQELPGWSEERPA
jgi:hypothetical protein